MARDRFDKRPALLRGRRTWLTVALVAVGLFVVVIYAVPTLLVHPAGSLTAAERLRAENDVRTTLVQALAGVILLAGLYFTARTLELNREGQITERFTRAIDQLGDDKIDVRLGGIYALERIARTSRDDHGPIMDVLTAFLRQHARPQADATTASSEAGGSGSESVHQPQKPQPPADIQAAVTVVGRRNRGFDAGDGRLDLTGVDLRGADLRGIHLEGVILRDALLADADLGGAYLTGASLRDAHLPRAILLGAHLQAADLGGAHLEGASLRAADLEDGALGGVHLEGADLADAHLERAFVGRGRLDGANLSYANLEGAFLPEAHLEHAVLYGASLDRADFGDAHLHGTDIRRTNLSGVRGLTRLQLEAAVTGEGTELPPFP